MRGLKFRLSAAAGSLLLLSISAAAQNATPPAANPSPPAACATTPTPPSTTTTPTPTPAPAGTAAPTPAPKESQLPPVQVIQKQAQPAPQSAQKAAGKTWSVGRTPDGQPDLQGMWTNYDSTPFERLSPGEEVPRGPAVSTADWLIQDSPTSPRRPSMVVDPPNGRVPLKREAIEKKDALLALGSDSLEHYGTWERCITPGVPGSMWPSASNN